MERSKNDVHKNENRKIYYQMFHRFLGNLYLQKIESKINAQKLIKVAGADLRYFSQGESSLEACLIRQLVFKLE